MTFTNNANGTLTGNGDSVIIRLRGNNKQQDSGVFLHLSGTFGSGTVKLMYKSATGNWLSLADASFTAATDKKIDLPNDRDIKLNVSGATSPSIYFEISAAGTSSLETL